MSLLRQPWSIAVCGLLLAFGFQAFLVYGLYSGDWLGLYYTGADVALPPLIEAEAPPRAPNPLGFDGQYYHVVAHDPLPAPSFAAFVDNPRLRWRRILAPASPMRRRSGSRVGSTPPSWQCFWPSPPAACGGWHDWPLLQTCPRCLASRF
ncbi:MAG: hypothetical protein R2724_27755 [Bryobacterales bacterium]